MKHEDSSGTGAWFSNIEITYMLGSTYSTIKHKKEVLFLSIAGHRSFSSENDTKRYIRLVGSVYH